MVTLAVVKVSGVLEFFGTTPCRHWIGVEARFCETVPTRAFIQGPRCADHAPIGIRKVEDCATSASGRSKNARTDTSPSINAAGHTIAGLSGAASFGESQSATMGTGYGAGRLTTGATASSTSRAHRGMSTGSPTNSSSAPSLTASKSTTCAVHHCASTRLTLSPSQASRTKPDVPARPIARTVTNTPKKIWSGLPGAKGSLVRGDVVPVTRRKSPLGFATDEYGVDCCGRPDCPAYPSYTTGPTHLDGPTVVDARAIASGRRRASREDYQAARDVIGQHQDRDKALRTGRPRDEAP